MHFAFFSLYVVLYPHTEWWGSQHSVKCDRSIILIQYTEANSQHPTRFVVCAFWWLSQPDFYMWEKSAIFNEIFSWNEHIRTTREEKILSPKNPEKSTDHSWSTHVHSSQNGNPPSVFSILVLNCMHLWFFFCFAFFF